MTPRRWRALRALYATAVSATLVALTACNSHSLEAPTITASRTTTLTFQETLNRKIDILFMVDNSLSMARSQDNLRRNLPRFMDVLKAIRGGLPDLHIAVVSSDMGTGTSDTDACNATGGDNGEFHFGVAANAVGCTSTGLADGAHFIASTGGATPENNFTGDITEVFQCIAPLGDKGCGYENQLYSVVRALGADGRSAPATNADFLRESAYLGIVMITNEDDCSAANPPDFYNQTTDFKMSSRLGPPGNFRCAEFGYLCGSAPPVRSAPNGLVTDTVTYNNCVPAEERGQLIPVATFAAAIKALKPDPASQILVASIQGPADTFNEKWKKPGDTTEPPWPDIEPSCTAADGSFAAPGIRTRQLVRQFGGNEYSICESDFGPALSTIAAKLSDFLKPRCVAGEIARRTKSTIEDCTVIEQVPDENGQAVRHTLRACADSGGAAPCWRLAAGTGVDVMRGENGCATDQYLVETVRAATPPDNLSLSVSCAMCIPGIPDPTHGCPG